MTTVAQSMREQGWACATAALGEPAPDTATRGSGSDENPPADDLSSI
jgi:hypothetical protein